MTNIWIGLAAGLVATLVLSALMLMKDAIALMPQMDMIGMISGMMKMSRPMGWLVHFIVGTAVYGLAYAFVFAPLWPGGILAERHGLGRRWLADREPRHDAHGGQGLFGMKMGAMVPVMGLVMHVFFGTVLGWVYGLLIG